MQHHIVAIRDIHTDSYFAPQFVKSVGGFLRQLVDDIANPQPGTLAETMNKHPSHFEIYKLGSWDDSDASFQPEKERLAVVSNLLTAQD